MISSKKTSQSVSLDWTVGLFSMLLHPMDAEVDITFHLQTRNNKD